MVTVTTLLNLARGRVVRGVLAVLVAAGALSAGSGPNQALAGQLTGIHKIRHVVIVMQENRSFDSYFGTYPGARGIPHGICVPDPLHGGCVRPFHDSADRNFGGPHAARSARADIHG